MSAPSSTGNRPWIAPLGLLAIALVASPAIADRIVLRGGGELRGVVVPDPKRPGDIAVQTENAAKPVVLTRAQVVDVVRVAGPLDEYLSRRASLPATAQAHLDLGLWCEANKLPGPAEAQFREALAVDPDFGPAQKKLGRVEYGGKWLTSEELREAQGLIKYKGRWITPQEKERIDARVSVDGEKANWARRIKILRHEILEGNDTQRRQAELQLASIQDPMAVTPLVQALGRDSDPIRLLLGQILGAIPGPEAASALFNRVLAEPDPSIRKAALDELVRRRERDLIAPFVAGLKSRNSQVVGRAAWALATLGATSAVPKLVASLVRTETQVVVVPTVVPGGGNSFGASFNSYNPGPIGARGQLGAVSGGGAVAPGPGAGSLGVVGGGSYGVLTGPVVGPGSVAFGAAAVPLYGGTYSNFGVGGMGSGATVQPMPQVVSVEDRNPEVLMALQSLTGVDFGFDVASWRNWLNTSFRPNSPVPPRRVPQP